LAASCCQKNLVITPKLALPNTGGLHVVQSNIII